MYSFIEEVANNQANIKVIGIGGGGCNAVERMLGRRMKGVEFIACNTDMQSLQHYHAQTCLQLGRALTRGLGAGGNPKIGRSAALEDEEMIRSHLAGADMVFVTCGLGGGTGTGGAPVVAQAARDLGILTIAVVTLPFGFEGKRRHKIAEAGIRELEEIVDTLIVVPNEKILAVVEPETTVQEAFTKADEILSNAVQGISDLITESGQVNVDFADVRTIMTDMGKAILGTGIGTGENRAIDAVNAAISSPLLDSISINGARGVLINITSGDDLGMMEMNTACDQICSAADDDALIIFGHVHNPEYTGMMKVTIIATGFERPKVRERCPGPGIMDARKSQVNVATEPLIATAAISSARQAETLPGDNLHFSNPSPQKVEVPVQCLNDSIDLAPELSPPGSDKPAVDDELNKSVQISPRHLRIAPMETAVILPSEALTSLSPVSPVMQPLQPELEPGIRTRLRDDFPSIPDYNKRDMVSGSLKKDSKLDRIAQRIYYGDINTPAFLRRKAD